jgi:hypothetical protein
LERAKGISKKQNFNRRRNFNLKFMPRKAKGKELRKEQFVEIKAKYEWNLNVQDIANEYGITREYLTRYAKKEGWIKGIKFNTSDTKAIVREKIAPQIIDKMNEAQPPLPSIPEDPLPPALEDKYEINKLRMRDRQNQINALTEAFMEDIPTNMYKTAYLGILKLQELLLKNKSYYQGREQPVGFENARNIDCIANATHKFAQILGFIQPPQQQNNTQINIGGEVVEKESERQLEKVKNRADFQDFVGKLQK